MLRSLAVRDFVIIESATFEPARGFTVLTGETGAGKSLLVDAIDLLVGGRGGAELVREGGERADLSAEFDSTSTGPLDAWLEERGLAGDAGTVLVRRAIERSGRSRQFINGHAVTLAQLREVGERLIDIHGQHEHQSLLRSSTQRDILDAQAGAADALERMRAAYLEWRRLEDELAAARDNRDALEREREQVTDDLATLENLAPTPGEWASLTADHARLAHGSQLLDGAQEAIEALSEGDQAVTRRMATLLGRLRALAVHDLRLQEIVGLLEAGIVQFDEASRSLRRYASGVELDPAALSKIESRIEAWHASARRLKIRAERLPERLDALRGRAAALAKSADLGALERGVDVAWHSAQAAARTLSAKRRKGADRFSREVTAVMKGLALGAARLSVALRDRADLAAHGAEDVEFETASHETLPLRPLAKVASGGELSRISLAIRLVATASTSVGTLVFDEVDSGVGGAVAESVGKALARLGHDRQVLCVTHLPQVASRAAGQWRIEKAARGAPKVHLVELDRRGRIEELARMLGGESITATTRRHAEEMLDAA